jgi:hypothetical protein
MKTNENIFLLSNENNYFLKVKCDYNDIIKSYCDLINFYVSYSIENLNIKDKEIFMTGLNVIQHIFRIMFLYTKNLELTIYNTQQSIYYYVEYITQITDKEDNIFFNLSIKDAVIYVYTRSVFEIKKAYVKSNNDDDVIIFNNIILASSNYTGLIKSISDSLFKSEHEVIKSKLIDIMMLYLQSNYITVLSLDSIEIRTYDEAHKLLEDVIKNN